MHTWDTSPEEQFERDIADSYRWLSIFPSAVQVVEKRVVDFGSGIGALSFVLAKEGAKEVLGLEVNDKLIESSKRLVKRWGCLSGKIFFARPEFGANQLDGRFDVVFSQNCFEHYRNPQEVLSGMSRLLRPGGFVYAGFGPLWNSPFGSHLRSVCKAPWAHLVADNWLIRKHNKARPHDPKYSWDDIGLNRKSFDYFFRLFGGSDAFIVRSFKTNLSFRARNPLAYKAVEILRRIPFLREYLTVSVFVILEKKSV